MPSKKKKYNARFPPAVQITSARNAKTLSPAHLKQCILAESRFDFLKDLVLTIPDVQTEGEDNGMTSMPATPTAQQHQPLVFRSLSEAGSSSSTTKSKATGTGRPRGRPRKNPAALAPTAQNNQRKWAGRKSDSEETDSGDSEDEEDDENSTDTESLPTGTSPSKNGRDVALATAEQASFQFNAVQPNFYQEIGGQNNSSFQIQINLPPETAPMNLNLTLNTDRAVNKIAFCSAVVAGFAYVGYSVCKTAFSRRRRGRGNDETSLRSVYLRRLSQTTQTDGLLGDFFTDGPPQIILRPKSVQERIRDLNMQARQFASAVTAIQSNSNHKINGVSGRSLQVTPWGSPRLLSPVEVRHIPEYHEANSDQHYSSSHSPNRYNWARNESLKSLNKPSLDAGERMKLKECEQLWLSENDMIMSKLPDLLSNSHREINFQQAQCLAAVLASNDTALILGTLTVMANLAVFSTNQDNFRESCNEEMVPSLLAAQV
uniref:EOG090X0H1B n=1 Tax=Daphnia barbata TaxID=414587 RepID=A0A4Y7M3B1_9CRUS|nr:EOG090X0H1B [Daphnia barbata]